MRAQENIHFTSAAPGPFTIQGGTYTFAIIATGSGTVTLQRLGPDGVTYINAATALSTSGAVSAALALPPGLYQIAIATFTNVFADLSRVPSD